MEDAIFLFLGKLELLLHFFPFWVLWLLLQLSFTHEKTKRNIKGKEAEFFLLMHHLNMLLQVFISIALILGDGLYNFLKILFFTIRSIFAGTKNKNNRNGKRGT